MVIWEPKPQDETTNPNKKKILIPNFKHVRTLCGMAQSISSIKFSPNGKYLASTGNSSTVYIWSVNDGMLADMFFGHTGGINEVAWSPDGSYLVTVSNDTTVKIWSRLSGQCFRTFTDHTDIAYCCDFSPVHSNIHNKAVVSGSFDKSVRIWRVLSDKFQAVNLSVPLFGHEDKVTAVSYNRDGLLIVSSSFDGTCRIWTTFSYECVKVINCASKVSFVKFSPNSRYLLIADQQNTLQLWDTEKKLRTYRKYKNERYCLFADFFALRNGYRLVVSGSEDNCVYIWSIGSRKLVQKLEAHQDVVVAVACHPKSGLLASSSLANDSTIKIWKTDLN